MSKISTALRAAALGPAPRKSSIGRTVGDWVSDADAFLVAHDYRDLGLFSILPQEEQRMFLLFVAEAEE